MNTVYTICIVIASTAICALIGVGVAYAAMALADLFRK